LLAFVDENKPRKLILNLGEVQYMDSSAIAVLVEALQKMRKTGGKIYLTNLQPRGKGLLEIARLDTIFVIAKDEADALGRT
jgi:anti-sigma B factor antagonist